MDARVAPGQVLISSRILAVIRSADSCHVAAVLDALASAGIRCLEVTMNTPGALRLLREARDRLPATVELGAGTVLTASDVDGVAAAGGSFVVAPDARSDVAAQAHICGLAYYPGALTPTEIRAAWDLGASAVKVFPARLTGPDYMRELRGPFPDIPLIPSGGVGIDSAARYLQAGAIAVNVGGALLGDALDGGNLQELRQRATQILAAVGQGD
jgi:2-dehydro-3-deoxyphosphogluconate aldolase / (4S)-4-hydroxy-2-oxoglutarate aldolase